MPTLLPHHVTAILTACDNIEHLINILRRPKGNYTVPPEDHMAIYGASGAVGIIRDTLRNVENFERKAG